MIVWAVSMLGPRAGPIADSSRVHVAQPWLSLRIQRGEGESNATAGAQRQASEDGRQQKRGMGGESAGGKVGDEHRASSERPGADVAPLQCAEWTATNAEAVPRPECRRRHRVSAAVKKGAGEGGGHRAQRATVTLPA